MSAGKNKKGMLPKFCSLKSKKGKMHAYHQEKCIALQLRDKKLVTLVSTIYSATMKMFEDTKRRELVKSSIVRDYNRAMANSNQILRQDTRKLPCATKASEGLQENIVAPSRWSHFQLLHHAQGRWQEDNNFDYCLALIQNTLKEYHDHSKKLRHGRPPRTLDISHLMWHHFPAYIFQLTRNRSQLEGIFEQYRTLQQLP